MSPRHLYRTGTSQTTNHRSWYDIAEVVLYVHDDEFPVWAKPTLSFEFRNWVIEPEDIGFRSRHCHFFFPFVLAFHGVLDDKFVMSGMCWEGCV